jgi:hypothetical protein
MVARKIIHNETKHAAARALFGVILQTVAGRELEGSSPAASEREKLIATRIMYQL